jgi:hypothetical protein
MEKIVSVAQARRVLGAQANALTDDQVRELLHTLKLLAREQLGYNGSKVDEYSNEPQQSNTST